MEVGKAVLFLNAPCLRADWAVSRISLKAFALWFVKCVERR